MAVRELFLEEALNFTASKSSKLVWIGSEPVDYICELLQLEPGSMEQAQPAVALGMSKKDAEHYKNCIFVCYHGVSSKYLAQMLKEKYDIDAGSLKGGVTAILGEIF
jgi:rhodanese-related sulfurtransferase